MEEYNGDSDDEEQNMDGYNEDRDNWEEEEENKMKIGTPRTTKKNMIRKKQRKEMKNKDSNGTKTSRTTAIAATRVTECMKLKPKLEFESIINIKTTGSAVETPKPNTVEDAMFEEIHPKTMTYLEISSAHFVAESENIAQDNATTSEIKVRNTHKDATAVLDPHRADGTGKTISKYVDEADIDEIDFGKIEIKVTSRDDNRTGIEEVEIAPTTELSHLKKFDDAVV